MNTENMKDTQQRRLAWRCRRGMLELDIVLQRFISQHYSELSLGQLKVFDELLDLPDNDFWGLISNENSQPKNADILSVINKIRAVR
jgi:antitoxin CptB